MEKRAKKVQELSLFWIDARDGLVIQLPFLESLGHVLQQLGEDTDDEELEPVFLYQLCTCQYNCLQHQPVNSHNVYGQTIQCIRANTLSWLVLTGGSPYGS